MSPGERFQEIKETYEQLCAEHGEWEAKRRYALAARDVENADLFAREVQRRKKLAPDVPDEHWERGNLYVAALDGDDYLAWLKTPLAVVEYIACRESIKRRDHGNRGGKSVNLS